MNFNDGRYWNTNKYIVLFAQMLILMFVLLNPVPSVAGFTFIDMYPRVYALTQTPPELSGLSVLCSQNKPSCRPYISFVGGSDKKVILVVFTDKPVNDLSKVITLKTVYVTPPGEKLASPSARVSSDATLDWAYVFDRNGDGRVDYMAFFYAALPIKPDNFPVDFPKGNKITSFEQFKLLLNEARLIFTHYADDNFDGSTDIVVAAIADPDRKVWVDRFGVLRSTKFNGIVDETWTFKKDISERIGAVAQENGKYLLQNGLGTPLQSGKELFDFGSRIFKSIKDYSEKCGLTKDSYLQK